MLDDTLTIIGSGFSTGGEVYFKNANDPGGNLAPPNSIPQSPVGTEWFNRGYTGHEYMDDFQLIYVGKTSAPKARGLKYVICKQNNWYYDKKR